MNKLFEELWEQTKMNITFYTRIYLALGVVLTILFESLRTFQEFDFLKPINIGRLGLLSIWSIILFLIHFGFPKNRWVIAYKAGNQVAMPYPTLIDYNKNVKRKEQLKYREVTEADYEKYPICRMNTGTDKKSVKNRKYILKNHELPPN